MPVPYVEGASLHLEIIHDCQDQDKHLPRVTTASINKILDVSLSPVMLITITLDSGLDIRAVLKLYDYRFGKNLRRNRRAWFPFTVGYQLAFEDFVRRDAIGPFLAKLNHDQEMRIVPKLPQHYLDGKPGQIERYEAALWQECENMFHAEIKAYKHLKAFQGTGIPRLLASIRLANASIPVDLINKPSAKYWDINGILLHYIPGVTLVNLDSSLIKVQEWQVLIQRTMDLLFKINNAGVVIEYFSPRNVIVKEQSLEPFVINFALSCFREELEISVHSPRESGIETEGEFEVDKDIVLEEGDSLDLESEYLELVEYWDNPGAIGAFMTTMLQKRQGSKI